MNLSTITYKSIKNIAHLFGFDIVRWENNPGMTFLGLRTSPFQTVIDVGANTGQFAKTISKVFPSAKLYCFEPLPDPFETLSAWSKKQNDRVVPFNLAIGDKECEVEMFLHEDHTPSSSFLNTTKLTEHLYPFTTRQTQLNVRQTTLDSVVKKKNIQLMPELLIKVDVQGYEDRVIAGGQNTFSAASACILEVALDALYEGQAVFKDLVIMLHDMKFRYTGNLNQIYGRDGHCIYLDAVFIK